MSQHLSFLDFGKAAGGQARVRTTFGKSDRVGSQGGLRKRELWWNYEPAAQTERVRVGNSPPKAARAVFLSRPPFQRDSQAPPSDVTRDVTPQEVTPGAGKGALGTWRALAGPGL